MDEIGDMPQELQANLLLPMEQRGVRRLGSVEVEPVDIRFVSATDRNLIEAMSEGRFREQLYHRLRECDIYIPALRERTEDIPEIVEYYVGKHNKDMGDNKSVSPGAIDYLMQYRWPGNVRELASTLRVAFQTMSNDELEVADLHRILGRSVSTSAPARAHEPVPPAPVPAPSATSTAPGTASESESGSDREKIEKALEKTAGNVSKAAAVLGISRETLHTKIKKHGIDVAKFRAI
jgi:two-component system NtrC family response regulator/two-component system nitrogen regulation response regulator GlnG